MTKLHKKDKQLSQFTSKLGALFLHAVLAALCATLQQYLLSFDALTGLQFLVLFLENLIEEMIKKEWTCFVQLLSILQQESNFPKPSKIFQKFRNRTK